MDLKLEAFACHRSQFPDFAEVATRVRARCATLGTPYGHAYAETFDRILIPRLRHSEAADPGSLGTSHAL